jgi:hypothetical protein
MRFFITNLLATAMIVFAAGSASAISLTLAGANGQTVQVGGQVTITVSLDTEGTAGITLLSAAVLFDNGSVAYNSAASSTTGYILYQAGKAGGPYMNAAADPPQIRYGTQNQVNVDFTSTNLELGTGPSEGYSSASPATLVPGGLLATLVFDVVALGDGNAEFALSISSPGNVIGLAGGATGTATLNGAGSVVVPEPTTAILVGLGLAGLGFAGRRRE